MDGVGAGAAAIVIDLALPSIEGMPVGIGEALGCSGGPNLAPDYWYGLNPERFFGRVGAVHAARQVALEAA